MTPFVVWGLLDPEAVGNNVGTVVGLTPIPVKGLDGKTECVLKSWEPVVYLALQGVLFHKALVLILLF